MIVLISRIFDFLLSLGLFFGMNYENFKSVIFGEKLPLIEIIHITLLLFSIGMIAFIGLSYLAYRTRVTYLGNKSKEIRPIIFEEEKQLQPLELPTEKKTTSIKSKFEVVNRDKANNLISNDPQVFLNEKFKVINPNPHKSKVHSPKFLFIASAQTASN